ncbi:uncharacterized protein T551_00227 [Pneumocystis jirovecii RU7]|uniref:Protein kinase domain-containing protein n=1 Tax=Pneumocystis jirovecii (strain RU7) TaxID=1408657 RepID=A0A0W4ZWJ1_PNEJ7|nr:uncharacterized protein T551_00227 [Pneumocystis jirovecii RU7]KTW32742.1 hypothetical protein T551_00227 [Pneumocystis jirovecii RU7]
MNQASICFRQEVVHTDQIKNFVLSKHHMLEESCVSSSNNNVNPSFLQRWRKDNLIIADHVLFIKNEPRLIFSFYTKAFWFMISQINREKRCQCTLCVNFLQIFYTYSQQCMFDYTYFNSDYISKVIQKLFSHKFKQKHKNSTLCILNVFNINTKDFHMQKLASHIFSEHKNIFGIMISKKHHISCLFHHDCMISSESLIRECKKSHRAIKMKENSKTLSKTKNIKKIIELFSDFLSMLYNVVKEKSILNIFDFENTSLTFIKNSTGFYSNYNILNITKHDETVYYFFHIPSESLFSYTSTSTFSDLMNNYLFKFLDHSYINFLSFLLAFNNQKSLLLLFENLSIESYILMLLFRIFTSSNLFQKNLKCQMNKVITIPEIYSQFIYNFVKKNSKIYLKNQQLSGVQTNSRNNEITTIIEKEKKGLLFCNLLENNPYELFYTLWSLFKDNSFNIEKISDMLYQPSLTIKKISIKNNMEKINDIGKTRKRIDDFMILGNLGTGAYGEVKLAKNKQKKTNKVIAIKYIAKACILVDTWVQEGNLGTIPLEIHILNYLKNSPHKNIIRMIDYFQDEKNYYILMNYDDSGIDLFDYIELHKDMTERECISIIFQLCQAVAHLHSLDIVHGDIKDENVVLNKNGCVKLIDFGSANYVKKGPFSTFHGTLEFAAPEILRGEKYQGKPQDIWALGILLFTIIYKENPFCNIYEIIEKNLQIPFILSEASIDLIKKMLTRNLNKRIMINDVLQHCWFDNIGEPIQIPLTLNKIL